MKKAAFLVLIFLTSINIIAQDLKFSDLTRVSLLTCSPGEEIYAKFGHTGIRLMDPTSNLDIVFNYGLFSFETNNFYLKFIKGETDYLLGVSQTSMFLSEYKKRNSTVWEQSIDLSTLEKRELINSLLENLKPENRKYRYNFIYDNCATRPRDKILNAVDGFINCKVNNDTKTYREWVGQFVGEETWTKFGIDLVFGMEADKITPQYESMFLPIVMMNEFQNVKVLKDKDSKPKKLVTDHQILVESENEISEKSIWYLEPLFIFCLILVISIVSMFFEYRVAHYKPVVESILLIITGATGFVIAYLMFFSVHPLVHYNFNILWLNPLNFIFGILIWVKSMRKTLFYYQIFNLGLLVLALITMALSVQVINYAAYPIIALLIARYARWFVRTKHKFDKRRKHTHRHGHSK